MSKNTVALTGALMTVATDMTLKAGMKVVVVNGVVLSIYSGDTAVPLAVREDKPKHEPRHMPPIPSKNDRQYNRRKEAGIKSYEKMDGSPLDSVKPIVDIIEDMLAKWQTIHVKDVLAAIKMDPKDKHRWKVNAAIAWLFNNDRVRLGGNRSNRTITRLDEHDASVG